MNKIFRIVWNKKHGTWVAVAETASTQGKTTSGTIGQRLAIPVFSPKLLVSALALLFAQVSIAAPADTALPSGAQVIAGSASVSQNAAAMTINQSSARAAINWNSFNVGQSAQVHFNQPSASSVTLNRVQDANPSQIFGKITAPGQVFLVNPSGVYFAPGASVDVGGMVATTHDINTDDFMAGKASFARNGASGSVVNEGELKAKLGGYIALLAPEVRNQGVIIAQGGAAVLSSGEAITLNFADSGSLTSITATASQIEALVENKQAIHAPGGLIILSARAADSLRDGVVNNSGVLEASSLTEKGGKIWLEGDDVTLTSTASIQATGAQGGGEVLIGGGWQGHGAIANAHNTTVDPGAIIDVSATQSGNGGAAVIWSDNLTTYRGSIAAKGGGQGGNGGQVEVSGKQRLAFTGQVDASASLGDAGSLLLDPLDIYIANTDPAPASSTQITGITSGTETAATNALGSTSDVSSTTWITPADLQSLLSYAHVELVASRDITVTDSITNAVTNPHHLALYAGRSIYINSDIDMGAGANLSATANQTSYGNMPREAGAGNFTMADGATIQASEIKITIGTKGEAGTATIKNLIGINRINIQADSIDLAGGAASIKVPGGWLAIAPTTLSRAMEVGGDTRASESGKLVLDVHELEAIDSSVNPNVYLGSNSGSTLKAYGGLSVIGTIPSNVSYRFLNLGSGGSVTLKDGAVVNTLGKAVYIQAGDKSTGSGSFTQEANTTINTGNTGNAYLNIYADSIALNGAADSIQGAKDFSLAPTTLARPMILNGTVTITDDATNFALDSKELATFKDGFNSITYGSASMTGGLNLTGTITLKDHTKFLQAIGAGITAKSSANISFNPTTNPSGLDLNFEAGTFTQETGATIDAGAGMLTLKANTMALNGEQNSIQGSSTLYVRPFTDGTRTYAGIADHASGLALSNSELATFKGGFSNMFLGQWAGGVTVKGALSLNNKVDFEGSGASILVEAAIDVAGKVTFKGPTTLSASVTATQGIATTHQLTISADNVTLNNSGDANQPVSIYAVDHGAHDLTVISDAIALEANWVGTGNRTVKTFSSMSMKLFSSATSSDLHLYTSEIGYLMNGTPATVTLEAGTHINVHGTLNYSRPLILRAGTHITLQSAYTAALIGTGSSSPLTLAAGTAVYVPISTKIDTGSSTMLIEAGSGDGVVIGGTLKTTNSSADAIILNAGKSSAAGTATGGEIVFSGTPTITVGTGGQVKLYTGNKVNNALKTWLTDRTGFTTNEVYGADETTTITDTSTFLAIYRESEFIPLYLRLVGSSSIYGETPNFTYALYNASSGGTVVTDASPSGSVSWSGTVPTKTSAVGSYSLTYSSGITLSNAGYALNAGEAVTWAVTARPITITADDLNKTYGDSDPTLTYQVSSGSLVNGDSLTGALSRAVGETVGDYSIDGSTLSHSNYAITSINGSLTINQRAITLSANALSKIYGGADPALTVSIDSGSLGSVTVSDTLADVTGVLSRESGEDVGNYDVALGTGSKAGNYNITFETDNNALTVSLAPTPGNSNSEVDGDGDSESTTSLADEFTTASLVLTKSSSEAAIPSSDRGGLANVDSSAINSQTYDGFESSASVAKLAGRSQNSDAQEQSSTSGITVSTVPSSHGNTQDSNTQETFIAVSVPKSITDTGKGFSFELPAAVKNAIGARSLVATQTDGNSLPGWVTFNPETQRFNVTTVPKGGLPLTVVITAGELRTLVVISERQE